MGSGKTVSAISIINSLINLISKDVNVFLLVKKSLIQDTWMVDIRKWLVDYEKNIANIYIIAYDTANSYTELLSLYQDNK